MPIVLKSGSLNLLEPSGPVQACNRITLPFDTKYVVTGKSAVSSLNISVRCSHPESGEFCLFEDRLCWWCYDGDKVESRFNKQILFWLNPLTPNDLYMSRTTPLTSKHCILYIYSTNVGTEYFKHALYSPFFSLQNAVCLTTLTCLAPVLFTFYIQGVLKLKK